MVGGGEGAFIGAVHRIAARLDDHYEFVAGALSSTPEKAARSAAALGLDPARTYPDFAAMAKAEAARPDGIEAVAIVTPNHLHAPAARAFLEAGIHVICDKPLTTTLEEARGLARRSRALGPRLRPDPQLHRLSAGAAGPRDGARRASSATSASSRSNIRRTGWPKRSRIPATSRPSGAPIRRARAPAAASATSARMPTTSPISSPASRSRKSAPN